jgi:hypothetical protein
MVNFKRRLQRRAQMMCDDYTYLTVNAGFYRQMSKLVYIVIVTYDLLPVATVCHL